MRQRSEIAKERYHRNAKYGRKELSYDSREHIVVDRACDRPKKQSADDELIVFPASWAAKGGGRETGFCGSTGGAL